VEELILIRPLNYKKRADFIRTIFYEPDDGFFV
jgi:hypothetical protein